MIEYLFKKIERENLLNFSMILTLERTPRVNSLQSSFLKRKKELGQMKSKYCSENFLQYDDEHQKKSYSE
jgi:hypothetical protein